MEKKYKFIDNRIINMNFQSNIFDKKNNTFELSVDVETTVMASAHKDDNKYLVKFKFDVKDKNDDFRLNVEIINRITLVVEANEELNENITKFCLPDLLGRARKQIKDLTIAMNIQALDLPPFDEELN